MLSFQRALVTGGAGFIGSHIVDALIKEGCDVTVLDNFSSGKLENLVQSNLSGHLTIVNGDIMDTETVNKILKDTEVIFHQAATKHPVERFVFASSFAVYGNTDHVPIKEIEETRPTSVYGKEKLTAEKYCQRAYEESGLETVVLRYFNAYGPRCDNSAYGGVIRRFAERLAIMEGPVIHGTGKQTRDFVFVDDVVRANFLAASSDITAGKIYNVASGVPTSIERLADILAELILGKNMVIPYEYRPQSLEEIDQGCADISLIQRDTGYNPEISIEEGLRRYLDSLRGQQIMMPALEVPLIK
jgi:UDP-glucose 4-epimerase